MSTSHDEFNKDPCTAGVFAPSEIFSQQKFNEVPLWFKITAKGCRLDGRTLGCLRLPKNKIVNKY
jgi:hypothetical protein